MDKKIKVVFLTGAGISQESGIKTFRDLQDGLWMNFPVSEVATIDGVFNNIKQAETFLNMLRADIVKADPNIAHLAIAELAKDPRFEVVVITQNIDNLHRKSGLKDEQIIELHGNIYQLICRSHPDIKGTPFKAHRGCYLKSKLSDDDWHFPQACPHCGGEASLSPNMTLFGESLDCMALSNAYYHAYHSDVFVQVGTSAQVFPAAGIIEETKIANRIYIDIADQREEDHTQYETKMIGLATEKVVELCESLKAKYA